MVGQAADQQKKLVVWFTNMRKGLVLNRTNNRTIRGAYGDDVDGWAGKLIVVFPTQTDFGGQDGRCTAGSYSTAEASKDVGCCATGTGSGQTCRSNKAGPGSAAGAGSGSRSG